MFFRQHAGANATLSYFFGCAGHQKAVAVDVVAGDEDWFMAEADKAGVGIALVIDTHVHADHYPSAQGCLRPSRNVRPTTRHWGRPGCARLVCGITWRCSARPVRPAGTGQARHVARPASGR
jgi:glyoxylase-like metal-dependent hydrolase (beta-lactamase superfamily II)